jgi:hypothetical protein
MRVSLLDPHAAAWAAFLGEARHDFYHLPAYVNVSARQDGGQPAALLVEDSDRAMLLPLVLRSIEGSLRDATSPYGYPGPITSGIWDPGFVSASLHAGISHLASERIVSLFIRLHPVLNPAPPQGVGTVVHIGETVCVDLTMSRDDLWSQTRRNHRQQIRQALDAGFEARVDDGTEAFSTFVKLYRATMTSVGADPYYFFDDEYFAGLRSALGERVHIALVYRENDVGAAGMFVETDGIVQMHLTGHDERFARYQPMKLLFHHVREWCQARGDEVLHLGGGRGGAEDSLFHFKAGFSPQRRSFDSLRVIVLEDEYRALVERRGQAAHQEGALAPFPLYRSRGGPMLVD